MKYQGFTLIESAIAIFILGLFLVPWSIAYLNYIERQKIYTNYSKFSEVKENINLFVAREGRYPMPASLLAVAGDAAYGQEAIGSVDSCVSWPTSAGVCRTVGADTILIGAVPFKAIGVDERAINDYWGRRMLFAVTETQTALYVPGDGQIITQALDTSSNIVQISSGADIVLVSLGERGDGGYSESGVLIAPCPNDTLESENCDFDNTFLLRENDTVFPAIGTASGVIGANYYDDFVEQQQSVPVDLWLQNLSNSDYALTYASRIGVGTDNPQNKVHVRGDVAVGDVMSSAICAGGVTNCFDPDIIVGARPEMDCTNALAETAPILRLQNSRVYCGVVTDSSGNPVGGDAFEFPADFQRIDCASTGMLMVGIDINGEPICADP